MSETAPGATVQHTLAAAVRVVWVDFARSVALLGVIVFHIAWDAEIFGLLPPGTTLSGGWAVFARLVAGSFLFLSGFSLVLAHGRRIRWPAFLSRLARIAGAALLVSLASYVAFPDRWIYFGILHAIAAGSLVALPFLALPPVAALAGAMALVALYLGGLHPFASPLLSFTGLSQSVRPAVDLLPLVPWLAPVLLGVGLAKWRAVAPRPVPPVIAALCWPGRHSLAIYLLHQPILLGLFALATTAF